MSCNYFVYTQCWPCKYFYNLRELNIYKPYGFFFGLLHHIASVYFLYSRLFFFSAVENKKNKKSKKWARRILWKLVSLSFPTLPSRKMRIWRIQHWQYIDKFMANYSDFPKIFRESLTWAYGKAGIRSRKRRQNRNPNLRNKNWRRFCLESVTNNNCSIKTFHPHIIFIYCYYIFYCRIFCVRRKIFLREFHIRVSVVTWDHDWHEYSSLCRLSLTMDETRSPFKKWVT